MSKRIILSLIFIVGVMINLYNFTDVFGNTAIPKFRPFGTSTTFGDSTNYVTLNKGFYIRDSIKTDLDLVVKGAVVLDTNRLGKIQYRGNGIYFSNDKAGGNMTFQLMDDAGGTAGDFTWLFGNYLTGQTGMTLDSATGLTVNNGNIQVSGTTQQIKLPSDTATDYDGNNAVTVNRQSGFIITKSLTTAGGTAYDITLTNSLITTSSKVHAMVIYGGGTCTNLASIIHVGVAGSGSCVISVFNPVAATSLNGTVKFQFWVWN